jgi:hypothetical protein
MGQEKSGNPGLLSWISRREFFGCAFTFHMCSDFLFLMRVRHFGCKSKAKKTVAVKKKSTACEGAIEKVLSRRLKEIFFEWKWIHCNFCFWMKYVTHFASSSFYMFIKKTFVESFFDQKVVNMNASVILRSTSLSFSLSLLSLYFSHSLSLSLNSVNYKSLQ